MWYFGELCKTLQYISLISINAFDDKLQKKKLLQLSDTFSPLVS